MKLFRLFILVISIFIGGVIFPQPQPGENGDGSGVDGEPLSGQAPIGSGLVVLTVLSMGYGAKKVYNYRRREIKNQKDAS